MSNRCQECGYNDYNGSCMCGRSPADVQNIEELEDKIKELEGRLATAMQELEYIAYKIRALSPHDVKQYAREVLVKMKKESGS